MPRKLLALNLALAAVSAGLVLYIVRQLAAPMPLPVGGRTAAAAQPAAPVVETPKAPPGAYAIVTSRNLFSPTRTEGPAGPTTIAASPLVRPNLFGIVVRDGGSIAYLEDPVTKRVVGYRVGDKIVGGTVQTIKADSVVIERPEGPLDVRLRDPGKPRAAQPGAPPMGPGGQLQPPPLPGVIPPAVVEPSVKTKLLISRGTPTFSSETRKASGRVALEELVEKAIAITSSMERKNFKGLAFAKSFMTKL